jgi:hypothetical protein
MTIEHLMLALVAAAGRGEGDMLPGPPSSGSTLQLLPATAYARAS